MKWNKINISICDDRLKFLLGLTKLETKYCGVFLNFVLLTSHNINIAKQKKIDFANNK